jgi:hypothetical protein
MPVRECFFCHRKLQRLIVYTFHGKTIWGCRTCNKNGRTRAVLFSPTPRK